MTCTTPVQPGSGESAALSWERVRYDHSRICAGDTIDLPNVHFLPGALATYGVHRRRSSLAIGTGVAACYV
jgi:hypothetical protein